MRTSGGTFGPKAAVSGSAGVAAAQHPMVTQTIAETLAERGNAIDAAIAGALVQATVQQDMTNHAGSIMVLFWSATDQRVYELNSTGVIVPGVAPIRPVPAGRGFLTAWPGAPMAVLPGFMPAMKALFERFATLPWERLCAPAVAAARDGHVVTAMEYRSLARNADFFSHSASGRRHFYPDGGLPVPGTRWRKPELAETLGELSREGPDLFLSGSWARSFVARARQLGWAIGIDDLSRFPPRWSSGLSYEHRGRTIVQFSPPERQAVYSSLVLGILDALGLAPARYWEDPRCAYLTSLVLRRATAEVSMIHDPAVFRSPAEHLMDPGYHATIAAILADSLPVADLTAHVRLAGRLPNAGTEDESVGSCETTIVDSQGNWVQMMNTFQSGGIPGEVVGGVPMVGSHATTLLTSDMCGWLAGGGRLRTVLSSTLVLDGGRPVLSLGSPANGCRASPLVLSNILDLGLDPTAAEAAPLMLAMTDDYQLPFEGRVGDDLVAGLARYGASVRHLEPYDPFLGSFQMAWRGPDGNICAVAGARRDGTASAL